MMAHSELGSWPMTAGWSKRAMMDGESWEVRAFAEDACSSGQWPPRSYSCNFCRREFRTAQALGGHMNVHRRERAHALQGRSASLPAPLTSSPPSQESISSPSPATIPWRAAPSHHPYQKPPSRCKHTTAAFSLSLNTVLGDRDDTLDLELRLGRSPCAV